MLAEPGRCLVGDAGLIEAEVVLISRKGDGDERRWVFLDIGLFNGLTETLERGDPVPHRDAATGDPARPVDPRRADLRQRRRALRARPATCCRTRLRIGDRVRIWSTGAYTASYSTVGFNGLEPLRSYVL